MKRFIPPSQRPGRREQPITSERFRFQLESLDHDQFIAYMEQCARQNTNPDGAIMAREVVRRLRQRPA